MSHPDTWRAVPTTQPILIYDGECGFCSRSIQTILRHEKKRELLFVTRQSEYGKSLRKKYGLEAMESMLWIENDAALTESAAVLRIARYLGGPFRIALVASIIPSGIRNWAYRLFAKNRHRFARNSQCLLPTPEQQKRFVT
jgi:predicted DCC family thiol-disulfide oxidoreductase YuxK